MKRLGFRRLGLCFLYLADGPKLLEGLRILISPIEHVMYAAPEGFNAAQSQLIHGSTFPSRGFLCRSQIQTYCSRISNMFCISLLSNSYPLTTVFQPPFSRLVVWLRLWVKVLKLKMFLDVSTSTCHMACEAGTNEKIDSRGSIPLIQLFSIIYS